MKYNKRKYFLPASNKLQEKNSLFLSDVFHNFPEPLKE